MTTKHITIAIIIALVLAGGSFYGGEKYAAAQKASAFARTGFQAQGGQTRGQGGRGGAGATLGQVISKDATSITIKLVQGGSKIVFLATSTPVMKTASSSVDAIAVGQNVFVQGTANTDGSENAQSIQIR